jgi:hypothetical protein
MVGEWSKRYRQKEKSVVNVRDRTHSTQITNITSTKHQAHPTLGTVARSIAVTTLTGMLAENEHFAYVVT